MSAPTPPPRPLLYGHRGAAAEQPENTMPSFRLAVELGAHALETDVHLTSDGHVVVAHDETGERMANVRAAIAQTTLRELKTWDVGWGFVAPDGGRPYAGKSYRIITLDELLGEFPGVPINVDLKGETPALVDAFLKLVRGRRDEARVTAASFHRGNIKRLRRQFYGGPTALAPWEVVELFALPVAAWRRLPLRGTAAQLPMRARGLSLMRRGIVDKCRAAGLRVDFWVVNDPAHARELIDLGVDGVMTDDPRALAPLWK
jgi:glycerophosphoryl diester phosphodiesterase